MMGRGEGGGGTRRTARRCREDSVQSNQRQMQLLSPGQAGHPVRHQGGLQGNAKPYVRRLGEGAKDREVFEGGPEAGV